LQQAEGSIKTEVGGQRSEDRGKTTEVKSQRAEGSIKTEVGGQRSEIRGQRKDDRGQKSAGRLQQAAPRQARDRRAAVSTRH